MKCKGERANLRISQENVHTVLSILLVLALSLKNELFQNVVVPGDDAVRDAHKQSGNDRD